jgi:hypothetical protein
MYIIINKTKKTQEYSEGDFMSIIGLTEKLNAGEDIIIISLYSNTIKVPVSQVLNGEVEWEWKDYNLPDPSLLVFLQSKTLK